jgi:hypothetical protein
MQGLLQLLRGAGVYLQRSETQVPQVRLRERSETDVRRLRAFSGNPDGLWRLRNPRLQALGLTHLTHSLGPRDQSGLKTAPKKTAACENRQRFF